MRIAKLAHATFETPDIQRLADYYADVLGLALVDRTAASAAVACAGDAVSVILTPGARPRCTTLAFETAEASEPAELLATLDRAGVKGALASDVDLGGGKSIQFEDINGVNVRLIAPQTPHGRAAGAGIAPRKIGHVAFKVRDVQATVNFYCDVLGFRVSDWMGDFFAFLRCGPDHHTVNFLAGAQPGMHHVAFEASSWDHIRSSSDELARRGVPIIWGPGRHAIGHNIFTYHRNADSQIVELYTDLDQMSSEDLGYFDPRPWHEDNPQRPKVWDPNVRSNAWGPPLPDGFRNG
jgi:catechol 2,3-dioxygenase-like lactoylglutathione lyase family enzyme